MQLRPPTTRSSSVSPTVTAQVTAPNGLGGSWYNDLQEENPVSTHPDTANSTFQMLTICRSPDHSK